MPARSRKLKQSKSKNLQRSLYSEAYLGRLASALQLFCAWLRLQSQPTVVTAAVIDAYLVDYLQNIFERSASLSLATHTVLAIQHSHRRFKHHLPRTWASIKSWKLQVVPRLRVPLPPNILEALVTAAMLRGFVMEPSQGLAWITFGVTLWLGFEGMLRPSELRISRKDITLPSQSALSFSRAAVILLRDPKNRAHFGRMQFATIRSERLLAWLEWLCLDLPGSASLCPLTVPKMRQYLKLLTAQLHIGNLGFTLSSLRTGGATCYFMTGVPIDTLRFAGRWLSIHTLEHYVQEAVATSVMSRVKPSVSRRVLKLLAHRHLVQLPPIQPWWRFFSRDGQYRNLRSLHLA